MDLLKIIRQKGKVFAATESNEGIQAILIHLEVAEEHFKKAKTTGDYLYTDVIYRTNQAFEGALKEGYRVFTGRDPAKISPYEIEKYIDQNRVLKERVLSLFTNYRTEWRNKSTHDYQLFFSPQEALLAIVSISAFFSILLDEMIERYAHDQEQQDLRKRSYSLLPTVPNYHSLEFIEQCSQLIKQFVLDLQRSTGTALPSSYAFELLGKLTGFIAQADPAIVATTHKAIKYNNRRFSLDLVLEKNEKAVVVELRTATLEWRRRLREGIERMKLNLGSTEFSDGILCIVPHEQTKIESGVRTFQLDNKVIRIVVMHPCDH